jgi:hypothetical protein
MHSRRASNACGLRGLLHAGSKASEVTSSGQRSEFSELGDILGG